jgi:hypothetical protein
VAGNAIKGNIVSGCIVNSCSLSKYSSDNQIIPPLKVRGGEGELWHKSAVIAHNPSRPALILRGGKEKTPLIKSLHCEIGLSFTAFRILRGIPIESPAWNRQ